MIAITTEVLNYMKAIEMVMHPDYVRPDHCDGMNGINRVAAAIELDAPLSRNDDKRLIEYLRSHLSEATVRPHRILVFKYRVIIEWYPNGPQVFMNRGQYAGFILQFVTFLYRLPIEDVCILEEFFDDNPDFDVKNTSDDKINFFPEFNSECFGNGSGEPIEVLWLTEKL